MRNNLTVSFTVREDFEAFIDEFVDHDLEANYEDMEIEIEVDDQCGELMNVIEYCDRYRYDYDYDR